MTKGKVIVVEGLDGSGKGTQSRMLASNLRIQGYKVHHVSFPDYDSDSSALIKMYLNGEFGKSPDDVNAYAATSFYAVDRFASFKKSWKKLYDDGYIIVADRYSTSNLIYQLAKVPNTDWDKLRMWIETYEYDLLELPRPDDVYYLSVPIEVSQNLMAKRYHNDDTKKDIHESNIKYLNDCYHAAMYCISECGWRKIQCMDYFHTNQIRDINDIQRDILDRILFNKVYDINKER